MDTKFSVQKALTPSGTTLLILLSLALATFTVSFDWVTGRIPGQLTSMSLPFAVCTIVCGGLGFWVVPILQRLKAGQFIREDGPQTHLNKAGTPTMGGVLFVPVAALVAAVWTGFTPEAIAVCAITLTYGFVGWLDDWQILLKKSNQGISPRVKLGLQLAAAIAFCLWLALTKSAQMTTIQLPFGMVLQLGVLFWGLAVFVFVAESNATNLTDGVDGLAAGTSAIAFLGLGALVAPTHPDLMVVCACISGACLGFVVHNRNPAKVFMGDTGSLALGGALAATGILAQNLWGLFVLSGLFFVESLSVIAQVGYYKATKGPDGVGKRLLKMAPIHHHLELSGWSETQIVGVFYLVSLLLALLTWLVA